MTDTPRPGLLFSCSHHGLHSVTTFQATAFTYTAVLACGCIWRQEDGKAWQMSVHRQQRVFGAAIVPNPDEPFKVAEKQLRTLDRLIMQAFPTATLTEGCKYARWADIPVCVSDDDLCLLARCGFYPDNIFDGVVFGRKKLILMWLPFFA